MIKSTKEYSKKSDPLPMLAYMVYEDFELYELVPILVVNTTLNNINHSHMFKNISHSTTLSLLLKSFS